MKGVVYKLIHGQVERGSAAPHGELACACKTYGARKTGARTIPAHLINM